MVFLLLLTMRGMLLLLLPCVHPHFYHCFPHITPPQNEGILHMRFKQMRNYLVALMMAVGTPMLVMGEHRGEGEVGKGRGRGGRGGKEGGEAGKEGRGGRE